MFPTDDWDPGNMMNGPYGNGSGMMNGGGWLMVLTAILLVLVLGTMIVLAFRATGSGPAVRGAGPMTGSPRDVLDLRLARGEISPEEYGTTRTLLDP
jgi:uncharacterized membrane protein